LNRKADQPGHAAVELAAADDLVAVAVQLLEQSPSAARLRRPERRRRATIRFGALLAAAAGRAVGPAGPVPGTFGEPALGSKSRARPLPTARAGPLGAAAGFVPLSAAALDGGAWPSSRAAALASLGTFPGLRPAAAFLAEGRPERAPRSPAAAGGLGPGGAGWVFVRLGGRRPAGLLARGPGGLRC
jgi:hypothetical protein